MGSSSEAQRSYGPGLRKVPAQARSRALVDALVEATAQLLAAGGSGGVTTNRVAERAGVSIGSLYQYFVDKEGLIQAVATRYSAALEAALDDAVRDADQLPIRSLMRGLFHGFADVERLSPGAGPALLRMRADGARFTALDAFERRLERAAVDGIRERIGAGTLQGEAAALSARVVVHTISGAFRSLIKAGALVEDGARVADELTLMAMGALDRWSRVLSPRAVSAPQSGAPSSAES